MDIDVQHFEFDNRRIAYRHLEGAGPAIVFLPGYMSDMSGSKATALFEWCAARGSECLLLDYSGCGQSSGDFAQGTLSRWRDEVLALLQDRVPRSPIALVGSSMGGWMMLLVGVALGDRLLGMVGIAAAPDFSDWGFDQAQKRSLSSGETIYEADAYAPEPTPTHARFWRDAESHKVLNGAVPLSCPVRLLHGTEDIEVPPMISQRLAHALVSEDVKLTLVEGGDHRLSRNEDIALLIRTVSKLLS